MHSRVNCAEMAGDRPRQPAYEIFSIECRFQKFKSGPFRFKEACTRGCQRGVPLLKVIIYPLLACLTWKWLQIGTDMLLNITSTGDELLRVVNIDHLDWPWTLKIKVFAVFFVIFVCERVNCDEMDGDWPRLPANRNCHRLSRISWALAQISCYYQYISLLLCRNTLTKPIKIGKCTWGHWQLMKPVDSQM